jgi:hypothetical protein
MKQLFKEIFKRFVLICVLMPFCLPAFAADDPWFDPTLEKPPSFGGLRGIAEGVMGRFLAASAAILVIMLAYSIIKGSLAAGNPEGLEGAKGTITYAIYGFLIIVFVFSLIYYVIIPTVSGVSTPGFGGLLDEVFNAIDELVNLSTEESSGSYSP